MANPKPNTKQEKQEEDWGRNGSEPVLVPPDGLVETPRDWVDPSNAVSQEDGTGSWDTAPKTLSELTIKEHTGKFNPAIAKILIYGESGTGKTRFASTFPNPIFVDVDHGMASVTEQVDMVDVNDFKEIETLYEFLKAGDHSYQTVVLDTLNEMQRLAMRATVEDFPMIRRAYNDLPGMTDYGKMLHDFIELTLKFINLPMRVVLLSQVGSRQFDTDVLQPQLVGKNSSREISRKMDIIGYIYKSIEGDKRTPAISFDATDYVTKDRSNRLPSSLPDPTYARMAAFWK